MSMHWHQTLSIADLARIARRTLPASVYGYVSGGSDDQTSLRANRAAFERWRFRPRPLVDVSQRSLNVALFGTPYAMPIGIAPMGVAGLCGFDADMALARAAMAAHVPAILSAASTTALERVMHAAPGTWYQAYLPAQRDIILPLLQRLRAANVNVLVVTVDVPIAAVRENELRNGFSVPLRLTPRLVAGALTRPVWLMRTFARTLLRQGIPHFENFTATRGGPILTTNHQDHRAGRAAMTWDVMADVRAHWPGVLLIKGILRAEDARRAQRMGCDGIIASNHGGRQLDGAITPLDALPAIVAAVPQTFPVLIDGGFRRGTDILKALALGARCVFLGRAAMYGLAAGGQAGVTHALSLLRRELDTDLALLGCPDVVRLCPDYLIREGLPP